jgi:hypothetical protein
MVHRGFYAEDNPSILDDDEGSEELAIVNKLLKRIQIEKVHQFAFAVSLGSKNRAPGF